MIPVVYMWAMLGGFALVLCFGAVAVVWFYSRKASGGLAASAAPIQAPAPIPLVDPEVLTSLSQRLALLEGRLPALQQLLDGYGAMATRMAELEARLPSLVDAMDRYSNQLVNAEKRTANRERTEKNKKLTVDEAADQMGLAAGKENMNPGITIPPSTGLVRASVRSINGGK